MEETVPGATVALLAVALEGVVVLDVQHLGGLGKERGPFLTEPAGALGPLSKRSSQSEVFCTGFYSGALAV